MYFIIYLILTDLFVALKETKITFYCSKVSLDVLNAALEAFPS